MIKTTLFDPDNLMLSKNKFLNFVISL